QPGAREDGNQGGGHGLEFHGGQVLPREQRRDGQHAQARGLEMDEVGDRREPAPQRRADGYEVFNGSAGGLFVAHDVDLPGEDDDGEADHEAVDDGGGDGAEPLAQPQEPGSGLDQAGGEDDGAEHAEAVVLTDEGDDSDEAVGR